MLVDSHCHLNRLDLSTFDGQLEKLIMAAQQQGISHILSVCVTLEEVTAILNIAKQYPHVSASVGLHPTEMTDEPTVASLIEWAKHPNIIAIGETGLDYYRCEGDMTWQQQRFRNHIKAAKAAQKPLIVHTRMARADTIKILQDDGASEVGGVMHCFTEDEAMAIAALDLNFYISFSGILTFRNATDLQALAKKLPLNRILIETDAPYLAPVPFRGKPNLPQYVRYVAEYLAELRGESFAKVAEQTTENFFQLFKRAHRA